MSGFPLAFAAPWALVGLLALPVLWWLLRVTPPRPRTVDFPPLRLLAEARIEEETPARTPWWLTVLRLLLAAAAIFALAGPTWRPSADRLVGTGPVWLVVDNGFSAAPDWEARQRTVDAILDDARADGRPVLLVATADGPAQDLVAVAPEVAATRFATIGPRSWSPDHGALTPGLDQAAGTVPPGDVVWVAEPVDDGSGATFAATLRDLAGSAAIRLVGADSPPPPALVAVAHDGEGVTADVRRIEGARPDAGLVRAVDRRGRLLDEQPYAFEGAASEARVAFDLPLELRNEIARVEIAGADSASAVQLLDDRWRRRTVGLISGSTADRAQPLLSPTYYLTRALSPFADIRAPRSPAVEAAVAGYVEEGIAAIVMADVGTLTGPTLEAVERFVQNGGVLIRFAGPRLAAGEDEFVPVPLRRGGRTLGGALSWDQPQGLASFSELGPYSDVAVPDDVSVQRMVLAEPSLALDEHTWATLSDGTPLVTAERIGQGWLVLFHVTADTTWSNLPISGAFVEMLRRTVALGQATGAATSDGTVTTDALLAPLSILDGAGRLVSPTSEVRGIPAAAAAAVEPGRETPPGLYGTDDAFRAVNLMRPTTPYLLLDATPLAGRATAAPLVTETGTRLEPWLFGLAFLLLVADAIAVLVLVGGLRVLTGRRPATAALVLAAVIAAGHPGDAWAQELSEADQKLIDAVSVTRLAYVETGDATMDETSEAGLWALTRFLAARTALEAGRPHGLDPETDELSVYPLIYWPMSPDQPPPSPEAMQRIDAFMKSGGTVLFDTRDQLSVLPGAGGAASPEQARLRDMLSSLDIPPLEPVPPDHVLTKAFYLMADFPGRYTGSPLWVEASRTAEDEAEAEGVDVRPVREGDGVSPIMITGNDFAGAWAADEAGSFLYPVIPGEPRQREFALRAGVNIVMYALTGNYKADQVHVPALLERLGQ